MTTLACSQFWRIVYDILETAHDDYCALYETYWSLPSGEIEEPILNGKKTYSLDSLMSLNLLLFRKKYLTILTNTRGDYRDVQDEKVLQVPENYIPFSRLDGKGFFLITTERGAELRRKIYRVKRSAILGKDKSFNSLK